MAEPVRFYLDEHIASLVTRGLRQRGIDVLTIDEAGRGGMADPDQFQFAAVEKRVMVTFDLIICSLPPAATNTRASPIVMRQSIRLANC